MVIMVKKQNSLAPLLEGLGRGIEAWGNKNIKRNEQEAYKNRLVKSGMSEEKAAAIAFASDTKIANELLKQELSSGDDEEYKTIINKNPNAPVVVTPQSPLLNALQPAADQTIQPAVQQQIQPAPPFPVSSSPYDTFSGIQNLIKQKTDELLPKNFQQQVQNQQDQMARQAGQPIQPSQPMPTQDAQTTQEKPPISPVQATQQPKPVQPPKISDAQLADNYTKEATLAALSNNTEKAKTFTANAKLLQKRVDERAKLKMEANKDFNKEIDKNLKNTREISENIQIQKELDESGKLPGQGVNLFANIMDKMAPGIGIKEYLLNNASADLFDKVGATYIKGLKDVFGGRVSITGMQVYLKQFPRLSTTPEGRKVIYNYFQANNDLARLQNDIRNEVMGDENLKPYEVQGEYDKRLRERGATLPSMLAFYDDYSKLVGKDEAKSTAANERPRTPVSTELLAKLGPVGPEGTILTNKATGQKSISKGGQWMQY